MWRKVRDCQGRRKESSGKGRTAREAQPRMRGQMSKQVIRRKVTADVNITKM